MCSRQVRFFSVRFYAPVSLRTGGQLTRTSIICDLPVTPPQLGGWEPRCGLCALPLLDLERPCLGGGRACFLDQFKHGPPEHRVQAGPARFWPDGHRQYITSTTWAPRGRVGRGSQLGRLRTRGGATGPVHRCCSGVCHYAPGMTAGRRSGGCLLLLPRKVSCH